MEIGCGTRARDFAGLQYVRLWSYEREAGRSVARGDSIGRVDSDAARHGLLRRIAAYHRKAQDALARRRAVVERWISRGHTST